jgi:hypothetical protein
MDGEWGIPPSSDPSGAYCNVFWANSTVLKCKTKGAHDVQWLSGSGYRGNWPEEDDLGSRVDVFSEITKLFKVYVRCGNLAFCHSDPLMFDDSKRNFHSPSTHLSPLVWLPLNLRSVWLGM